MSTTSTASSLATDFSAFNKTSSSASTASSSSGTLTAQQQNDRFLKLLTTQLTNQDPLNPLDNSQMTSQMAQISTVSGIESLNSTIDKLTSQFVGLQTLQGAALVGHSVVVEGDKLAMSGSDASGMFELSAAADTVKLEVLNAAGTSVKTVNLGAKSGGQQDFAFTAKDLEADGQYSFRITATSGGESVTATPLMLDKVNAVSTSGSTLTLELKNSGSVSYDTVKSVH